MFHILLYYSSYSDLHIDIIIGYPVHRKKVLLHRDNVRPHTAKLEKMKKFNCELTSLPTYSPDLAPSD